MDQTAASGQALGVMDTLTQMVGVLGFHDVSSFFMTSIFVIAAAALLISGGIAIVKSQRERRREIEKIVNEVQAEASDPKKDQAVPRSLVEPEAATKDVAKAAAIVDVNVAPKQPEKAPIKIKEKSKPVKKAEPVLAKTPVAKTPAPAAAPAPVQEDRREHNKIILEMPTPKPVVEAAAPAKEEKLEPAAAIKFHETVAPAPAPVEEIVAPVVAEIKVDDGKTSLGAALKGTRTGFMEKLARIFSRGHDVSDADFEEMEAILFTADIGVKTAQKLLDVMRDRARAHKGATKEFLRTVLKEEMTKILLSAHGSDVVDDKTSPQIIMFVGVNGAGKTTSIGKLGAQLAGSGKKVLFGAGDTFRAAAVEQLSIWGQRVGAEVVSGKENSDSAAVLFEAIEKAKSNQIDYVLCDTAGRLHTKVSLMDELKKVHRVVSKAQTGAPHQVYLVIDATMGQNAINQAREFLAATPLTGVVLSKLDGTAKGGVALGIVDELKVPIRYIGIGESVADLRDFDAKLFVDALFEEA